MATDKGEDGDALWSGEGEVDPDPALAVGAG